MVATVINVAFDSFYRAACCARRFRTCNICCDLCRDADGRSGDWLRHLPGCAIQARVAGYPGNVPAIYMKCLAAVGRSEHDIAGSERFYIASRRFRRAAKFCTGTLTVSCCLSPCGARHDAVGRQLRAGVLIKASLPRRERRYPPRSALIQHACRFPKSAR